MARPKKTTSTAPTSGSQFIYLGPARETGAFGYVFPKDEPVTVTDPHATAKLSHNPCFTSVK